MQAISSLFPLYKDQTSQDQQKGILHRAVDHSLNRYVFRPANLRPDGYLSRLKQERKTLLDLGALQFSISHSPTGTNISALYIRASVYREKLEKSGELPLSQRLVIPLPIRGVPRALPTPKTALIPMPAGSVYETSQRLISNYIDRGFDILTFNYSGLGESSGTPSEEQISSNVKTVYLVAVCYFRISRDQILGVGTSLGGAAVLSLVEVNPSIPLILDRTFSDLPTVISAKVPNVPFIRPLVRSFIARYIRLDAKSMIAKAEGRIVIIRAKDDQLIPKECADLLFASAVEGAASHVCLVDLSGCHSMEEGLLWMHDRSSQEKFEKILN